MIQLINTDTILLKLAQEIAARHGWKTVEFKTLADVPASILQDAKIELAQRKDTHVSKNAR